MKNRKRMSAVLMAAVLIITAVNSPAVVYAQEVSPPVVTQEGSQENGVEETTPDLASSSIGQLSTGDVEITEQNFPDAAFREYVKKFDKNPKDDVLSADEIKKVTDISVAYNKNIYDLTGIENFTSLKYLTCNDTGIISLDVSHFPELLYLTCNNTKIKELKVDKNIKLTDLYCYNTGIDAIDVYNNEELLLLNCDITNVAKVDVSNNKKLVRLFCGRTAVTDIDVSGNKYLRELRCYNTGITNLDVSNNTKLETLTCYNTPLTWLNIGNNDNLNAKLINPILPATIDVTGNSFDITSKIPGINLDKVEMIQGGKLEGNTVTLDNAQFFMYEYACGTSAEGPKVLTVKVNLNITKLDRSVEITKKLDKIYDGTEVSLSKNDVSISGSTGDVQFVYEEYKGDVWNLITENPKNAGTYRVTAQLKEDTFNNGASSEPEIFTISQIANSWINAPAIKGWTYGEKANTPSGSAKYGDVIFTYSDSENGNFTDKVPDKAGTWYLKASVEETQNYAPLKDIREFKVSQAANSWISAPAIKGWTYGEKANTPSGSAKYGDVIFTYSDSENGNFTDKVPDKAGTFYMKASVEETMNYMGLEEIKKFTIAKKSEPKKEGMPKNDDSKKNSSTGKSVKSVKTGDISDTGMLVNLSALSLAIVGIFICMKRKKNMKDK